MEIKVPFLKQPTGLGDMAKAATSALGVKPCAPCQARAARLNRAVTFVPSRESEWTVPPEVPDGWTLTASCGNHRFYERTRGGFMIWTIENGQYRNSHSFCCEAMRAQANAKWEALCRP